MGNKCFIRNDCRTQLVLEYMGILKNNDWYETRYSAVGKMNGKMNIDGGFQNTFKKTNPLFVLAVKDDRASHVEGTLS